MGFIPRGGERNFQRVSSANLSKDGFLPVQLSQSDEMRRPVSGRDAVRSQVIDVL